jgi:hypothetical protein
MQDGRKTVEEYRTCQILRGCTLGDVGVFCFFSRGGNLE